MGEPEEPPPGHGSKDRMPKSKRTKLGRYTNEITKEEIEQFFHLPSEEACKQLGVGLTILKRLCRKFGIERWPYRRVRNEKPERPTGAGRKSPPREPNPGGGSGAQRQAPGQEQLLQQNSQEDQPSGSGGGSGSGSGSRGGRISLDEAVQTTLQRRHSERLTLELEADGLQRAGSLKRGRSIEVVSSSAIAGALAAAPTAAAVAAWRGGGGGGEADADLLAEELAGSRMLRAASLKKRRSVEQAWGGLDGLDQLLMMEQQRAGLMGQQQQLPQQQQQQQLGPRGGPSLDGITLSIMRSSSTPAQLQRQQPRTPHVGPMVRKPSIPLANGTAAHAMHAKHALPASLGPQDAVARWQQQQLAALQAQQACPEPSSAFSMPTVQQQHQQQHQQQDAPGTLRFSASDALLASFIDNVAKPPAQQQQQQQQANLSGHGGMVPSREAGGLLDSLGGWEPGAELRPGSPPAGAAKIADVERVLQQVERGQAPGIGLPSAPAPGASADGGLDLALGASGDDLISPFSLASRDLDRQGGDDVDSLLLGSLPSLGKSSGGLGEGSLPSLGLGRGGSATALDACLRGGGAALEGEQPAEEAQLRPATVPEHPNVSSVSKETPTSTGTTTATQPHGAPASTEAAGIDDVFRLAMLHATDPDPVTSALAKKLLQMQGSPVGGPPYQQLSADLGLGLAQGSTTGGGFSGPTPQVPSAAPSYMLPTSQPTRPYTLPQQSAFALGPVRHSQQQSAFSQQQQQTPFGAPQQQAQSPFGAPQQQQQQQQQSPFGAQQQQMQEQQQWLGGPSAAAPQQVEGLANPELLALQHQWSNDIDLVMHQDDVAALMRDMQPAMPRPAPMTRSPPMARSRPQQQQHQPLGPGGQAQPGYHNMQQLQQQQQQLMLLRRQQQQHQQQMAGMGAGALPSAYPNGAQAVPAQWHGQLDTLQRRASAPVPQTTFF